MFVDKSTKEQEDYKTMKQIQDKEIADGVKALLCILCVLSTACAIGLTLAIVKAALTAFGIEHNL